MGGKALPTQSPLVLLFFLLHHLGIFILIAYFILLEIQCISNSFIFFPLSLIHLIFNPLLLHFPSHDGQEYIGRHVFLDKYGR